MENDRKIPQHWFLKLQNIEFEDLIDLEKWRISQDGFQDSQLPFNSDIGISLVSSSYSDRSYVATDVDIESCPYYKGFSEINLEYFKKHISDKKEKVDKIITDLDSINESTYREILIDAIIKYGSDEFESKEDCINFAKRSREQLKEHFDSILEHYKNN